MKTDRLLLAPDKVFERLQSFCIARRVEGSTVIFLQGEAPRGVLLLLRGDIALTPDATQPSLCRVAGAGSILGLPANLSSKPYSLTAVAVEACEIASVPRKRFIEALRGDPELTLGIVQILAEAISEMQNLGVQFRLAHMDELAIQ
jgi:CRP-like cAMP-binding protein